MGKLDNRVAIVTGASSGVGRGVAKVLAQNGAKVCACARRMEKLEELAAGGKREALLKIPSGKLGLISKLYTDAQILELNYTGDGAEVRTILDAATYGRLKEYITGDEGFTNDEE